MTTKFKFGVALSGGGYRAAAFHLGTLRYLNKSGALRNVDYFSCVSGGSIVGAAYCLSISGLGSFEKFESSFREKLGVSIIKRALLSPRSILIGVLLLLILGSIIYFAFFSSTAWLVLLLIVSGVYFLIIFQFKLFPVSKIIQQIYDEMFYEKASLTDLPEKPLLVINSTNLQTGRLFYFTRDLVSDSTYDNSYNGKQTRVFKHEMFSIAQSVMASSCVPSFFTPITIGKEYLVDPGKSETIQPVLVDGGVYDNQGIHKLTHETGPFECSCVVVSDAGNLLPLADSYKVNILTLLMRTVEVFMTRIKNFQMMVNLYQNRRVNGKEIAYITLGWDIGNLISGFVRNLRDGNIIQSVRDYHGLTDDFVTKNNDDELVKYMESVINFSEIKTRIPGQREIQLARGVATNLTALSKEKIDALSNYAEVMTEVQTKLYCPSLKQTTINPL